MKNGCWEKMRGLEAVDRSLQFQSLTSTISALRQLCQNSPIILFCKVIMNWSVTTTRTFHCSATWNEENEIEGSFQPFPLFLLLLLIHSSIHFDLLFYRNFLLCVFHTKRKKKSCTLFYVDEKNKNCFNTFLLK